MIIHNRLFVNYTPVEAGELFKIRCKCLIYAFFVGHALFFFHTRALALLKVLPKEIGFSRGQAGLKPYIDFFQRRTFILTSAIIKIAVNFLEISEHFFI